MSPPDILYSWVVPPEGLPRRGGVTGDRERAMGLAGAALAAVPSAVTALVEAVRAVPQAILAGSCHERIGQSWPGTRGPDGTVTWTEHPAGEAP